MVEIYPREGTETLANEAITNGQTLKFIPVRGRKRGIAIQCDSPAVEIYPREGTETRIIPNSLSVIGLKFIPVRGRKRVYTLNLARQILPLKFIPVRGRKRSISFSSASL